MSTNNISLASLSSDCARALLEAKGHEDKAKAFKDAANVTIAQLHKAKAVIGRNGTCASATAFHDTLTSGGWAKGTANNYLSVFRHAVKTGKPVSDWNANRDGKGVKGKAVKGKAPKQSRENPAMDALFKMIKTDEGLDVLAAIQMAYDDDEGTIIEIVIDMLKAEGFKIESGADSDSE